MGLAEILQEAGSLATNPAIDALVGTGITAAGALMAPRHRGYGPALEAVGQGVTSLANIPRQQAETKLIEMQAAEAKAKVDSYESFKPLIPGIMGKLPKDMDPATRAVIESGLKNPDAATRTQALKDAQGEIGKPHLVAELAKMGIPPDVSSAMPTKEAWAMYQHVKDAKPNEIQTIMDVYRKGDTKEKGYLTQALKARADANLPLAETLANYRALDEVFVRKQTAGLGKETPQEKAYTAGLEERARKTVDEEMAEKGKALTDAQIETAAREEANAKVKVPPEGMLNDAAAKLGLPSRKSALEDWQRIHDETKARLEGERGGGAKLAPGAKVHIDDKDMVNGPPPKGVTLSGPKMRDDTGKAHQRGSDGKVYWAP